MALVTFDDFSLGDEKEFGSYKVTREEVLEFAHKYDTQSFHTDEEAAVNGPFGGLIASGWHTCSMCMRMLCDELFTRSAGCGSPGVDEIRWKRPVRPGDTLRTRVKVTKLALSRSKPDRGTVWTDVTILNDKDEVVATFLAMTIFLTRAGATAAGM